MATHEVRDGQVAQLWNQPEQPRANRGQLQAGTLVTVSETRTLDVGYSKLSSHGNLWTKSAWLEVLPVTPPPPPPDPDPPPLTGFWRVKHDRERPRGLWRPKLPEVFRLLPAHHVIFTGEMQRLWFGVNDLLTALNPLFWRKLGGNSLYLFNGGHGFPGHHDYVNNLETNRPDPRAPQMLICGGALVKGRIEGDKLWLHYIDTNKPLPSVEEVVEQGLYWENVTVQADGSNGRFPQGKGKPTYTPLFASRGVYLFLEDLVAV